MKTQKITIIKKHGAIKVVGDMERCYQMVGASKIRVGDVQPTRRAKIKRTLKRLYRAFRYACGKTQADGKRYQEKIC